MKSKVIVYGTIAFIISLGWNVLLIKRDEKLFDNYEKKLAIEQLKKPPSNSLREWCKNQAGWHPDCNLE